MIATMRIEIGAGTNPRSGYTNFDPTATDPAWRGRLGYDPIPVGSGTVEAVYASHVVEHIPAGQPRIDAFNEVWRILKPGCPFEIVAPCAGYTDHADLHHVPTRPMGTGAPVHAGWQMWSDPTHVSVWWFPESFWYFCNPAFQAHADYGKEMWDAGPMELHDGWEAAVTLIRP